MGRSAKGSVRLRNGKWLAELRGEHLGSFVSKQAARDEIAAQLRVDSDTAPDSLHLFGEAWLEARELAGDTRGIDQERSVWRQHIETASFYDFPLRKIRPVEVQRWLDALSKKNTVKVTRRKVAGAWVVDRTQTDERISRQTVVHARRVLGQCFRAALIAGKVSANPVDPCITPKMATVTEDDDAWTFLLADEIERLFAAIERIVDDPTKPGAKWAAYLEQRRVFYRAWYSVAIYGGLRLEEIKGLRWEDLKDGKLCVRRSSRGPLKEKASRRDVPVMRQLRDALHAWQRAGGLVKMRGLMFPADGGGHFGASYDAAWETRWRAQATGRDYVRHHDLRHTCGSHLVMGTWGRAFDLHEVRDWLGHADISTTQRYAHLGPGALAASVREMEEKRGNIPDRLRGKGSDDR